MKFIELTLQNHTILHGFDARNQEITEAVTVETPSKKLVAVDRILSVSERFILIKYAYDRIIYWEYLDGYEEVLKKLSS
ncbi:hypothetical protein HN014_15350 [Aquimarina sp. TRL1]|uniref:hypothetical protein n=1 Tax=Aquimarina sp. (strain TRL1) TaxID=2736252 RepID=UPI00158E5A42|nr:hypothetical protein [Aquimarina sp. TRL1]QKX06226.1 hypothetical protein HN014_15350 [Aquimarina sp. TRL1]